MTNPLIGLGPNKVYQGDCLELFGRLETGSIPLVFADPPFNIGYEYDVYDDRQEAERYLEWTRRWGTEVVRVLKPTGTFWLAIGDEYAAELKLIFQKELGLTCRSWVIWYYTFGVHCTKKFSRSHTHLLHFVKDPRQFTFKAETIKIPSARQLVYADSRAVPGGRMPDDTWILRPQDLTDGFGPTENTWFFSRVCGTFKERRGWHGCQMPEQLLGRIIRVSSHPEDIVLDPFAGSGTTLVVAKKLGRRWLGFELSKNYAKKIETRLARASQGQSLEGAEEPRVSAPSTPDGKVLKKPSVRILGPKRRGGSDEIKRGIVEAFFSARDGFSVDRVIADPDLNARFSEACRRLGLPGGVATWNQQLMNLRKASFLTGLPSARRTSFSREEIDRCEFACEIAIQQLDRQEKALDRVLCDPDLAAELDRMVRAMIPSSLSSLLIRWVGLKLRKRAHDTRTSGSSLRAPEPLPEERWPISCFDSSLALEEPGIYLLESDKTKLYVGETWNLRRRFQIQLECTQFDFWNTARDGVRVGFTPLRNNRRSLEGLLVANQSHWIREWEPVGNYRRLAAS